MHSPSMAVPLLRMMALTSAKSTLMRPGMVMMSEMPCKRDSQRRIRDARVERSRAVPHVGWDTWPRQATPGL